MRKIGILTFHRAENFGAVLQCYALQQYLKNNGFAVEIIDYRNVNIENGYKIFRWHKGPVAYNLKQFIANLLTFPAAVRKKKGYQQFRERFLNCSREVVSSDECRDKYDYIICGSDQIWNLRLTGKYDKFYFLDFETSAKKISYASSAESKDYELLLPHLPHLRNVFATFSGISVRENCFAAFLKQHTPFDFNVVCDPTFLQDRKFYENIMELPDTKNYILIYHLVESEAAVASAEYLAKKTGLKIVEIHAGIAPRLTNRYNIQNIGPQRLLGYIHNAAYVITTSFHGLALSVILEKQFYIIKHGPNRRLLELLTQLDVSERAVNCLDQRTAIRQIDYPKLRERLHSLVADSKQFLQKSLER